MQSYVLSPNLTGWNMVDNQSRIDLIEPSEWIIDEDEISPEILLEQIDSGKFKTLSAEEAKALEAITASRVKIVKNEPTAQYRRPKSNIFASVPSPETALKASLAGALAIGIVVVFFCTINSVKVSAPKTAARTVETTRPKVIAPHHVVRSYPAVASARTTSISPPNTRAAVAITDHSSVVNEGPVPEYKGPSSVTGAAVPHRRAYQTAALSQ